jgi:hypothetical protein
MKTGSITRLLFVSIVLAACSVDKPTTQTAINESEINNVFATTVPLDNWNDVLTVNLVETVNSKPQQLSAGSIIAIRIENMSNQKIVFPDDFGLKLMTYSEQNGIWESVPNRFEYMHLQPESKSLSPHGVVETATNLVWMKTIYIHPVPNIEQPILMRVIVIGNIYEYNTLGAEVGAYTDIILDP